MGKGNTAENLKKEDGQQGVILKNAAGKDITVERYRDITMTAQDDTRIIIIACENQEEIHYAMPVRNMLYDSLNYVEQINDLRRYNKTEKQLKGNAVNVLLGSEKLLQNVSKNKSGGIDMCQALDEYYQDGVNEGIERGIQTKLLEQINKKLSKGQSVQEIADALEESVEEIQRLVDSCKLCDCA